MKGDSPLLLSRLNLTKKKKLKKNPKLKSSKCGVNSSDKEIKLKTNIQHFPFYVPLLGIVGEQRQKIPYVNSKIKISFQLLYLICRTPKIDWLTEVPVIAVSKTTPNHHSVLMWRLHHNVAFMLQQKEPSQKSQNNQQTEAKKKKETDAKPCFVESCSLNPVIN